MLPDGSIPVPVDVEKVIARSSKAILCDFGDGVREWIPYSQIDTESDVMEPGDSGEILISRWLAAKKGLI